MSKKWFGALTEAGLGASYGLFNASQKYPADYWHLLEGQVRIGAFVLMFVVVAAIIGYGTASVSRTKNSN